MSDDLLGEYIAELQREIGVKVYEAALQRAIGSGGEY
jgi:hypothetical protein